VGLLDRFEQRLDRLVNGAFARAFKAEVQPIELASALQREMDDRSAVVARGRGGRPAASGLAPVWERPPGHRGAAAIQSTLRLRSTE